MKMRFLLTSLAICFLGATVVHADGPTAKAVEEKQIMIEMRICEGKAGAKLDDKSVNVLSAPKIVTIDGQSAQITIGGAAPLASAEQFLEFGIRCDITPYINGDGKIVLKLAHEQTELVKTDAKDQITAKGSSVRSIIVLKPGEKTIVGMNKTGNKQSWMEVTAEVLTADHIGKTASTKAPRTFLNPVATIKDATWVPCDLSQPPHATATGGNVTRASATEELAASPTKAQAEPTTSVAPVRQSRKLIRRLAR